MEPAPETPPEEDPGDSAPRTTAQAGVAEASGDAQEGK